VRSADCQDVGGPGILQHAPALYITATDLHSYNRVELVHLDSSNLEDGLAISEALTIVLQNAKFAMVSTMDLRKNIAMLLQ
jgi:hypothetical protein